MTEQSFLDATRTSYDDAAESYSDLVVSRLPDLVVERAMFQAFAEHVLVDGGGPVADVGCGPGHVTAHLAGLGLDVFGVDLSPRMVDHARERHPGLRFDVGSMLALDVADANLGGLLAFYSIIHVPWEHRPSLFAEFRRVLRDGGWLMLGFQIGDERRHRTEAYGRAVDLTWYRQRPGEVSDLLSRAGFDVRTTVVGASDAPDGPPHGLILARAA